MMEFNKIINRKILIKKVIVAIVFAGLVQSGMAQIRVSGSRRSINILASKQLKYRHELGSGACLVVGKDPFLEMSRLVNLGLC